MTAPAAISQVVRIPLELLDAGGHNARGGNLGDLEELAVSLRTVGQQQPIVVCEVNAGRFGILDGFRRRAAAELAHLTHLDGVVRRPSDTKTRIQQQLAMHVQRAAFNPIAEAEALEELVFEQGVSHEQVARACGKSTAWVSSRLGLLNLTEQERSAVASGQMSLRSADELVVQRRAERDGHAAPVRPVKASGRAAAPPALIHDTHFNTTHRLATDAGRRCRERDGDHAGRVRIGGVACGECWEYSIRVDQTRSTKATTTR